MRPDAHRILFSNAIHYSIASIAHPSSHKPFIHLKLVVSHISCKLIFVVLYSSCIVVCVGHSHRHCPTKLNIMLTCIASMDYLI